MKTFYPLLFARASLSLADIIDNGLNGYIRRINPNFISVSKNFKNKRMSNIRKKRKLDDLNLTEYLKGVNDKTVDGEYEEDVDLGKFKCK